jgi:N-ethylmaleimide reductase
VEESHRRRAREGRANRAADLARRARLSLVAEWWRAAGGAECAADYERRDAHAGREKPYEIPRELRDDELPGIVAGFLAAAQNAHVAGFDGVEVHGANGYLLDEFLRDGSNGRTGRYGGSIENRARLLLEVVDAAIGVWGAGRVGVRISPLNSFNDMKDSDPVGVTTYVAAELDRRGIAYLHLMRGDFFGVQTGDVMTPARAAFKGALIGNMGYTPAEAAQAVADGRLAAVAFGHHYVSNPDLVERVKTGAALVEPDGRTLYTQDAQGYTDYPALAAG